MWPLDQLAALVATDPYAAAAPPPGAKRVVSFLGAPPPAGLRLPIELDGARIIAVTDLLAFSAYLPSPRGPVFMTPMARALADDVTTRAWAAGVKGAAAGQR